MGGPCLEVSSLGIPVDDAGHVMAMGAEMWGHTLTSQPGASPQHLSLLI